MSDDRAAQEAAACRCANVMEASVPDLGGLALSARGTSIFINPRQVKVLIEWAAGNPNSARQACAEMELDQ